MVKRIIVLTVVFVFFNQLTQSQEVIFKGNPDASFENARQLAFNQQRAKAQDTLRLILTKYPNYHDVRSFLASTYSWDKKYDEARKEFQYILDINPNRKETWIGAINNELWADKPRNALEEVTKALTFFQNDEDLLYLKASALEDSRRVADAYKIVESIVKQNPANQKAVEYKNKLIQKTRYNSIGFSSTINLYSEIFDPAQEYALKIGRKTSIGSIIGRININNRFDDTGLQFEIDAYPKIADGIYAYLNFGYSNTNLFPDYRHGAEVHFSLPYSMDGSLGYRALHFGNSTTKMYTGSIGLYTGNYYIMFRPYFTPNDAGTSTSGTLTLRKYSSDEDNYLGFSVGLGVSPEIDQLDLITNAFTTIDLKSQSANFSYNFTSKTLKHAFGTKIGITHREKSFSPGDYLWIYSLGVSWELRYR